MNRLIFGRDHTCPTCHGSGTLLGGKLECSVCHGTGITVSPAPPPTLPAGPTTGEDHPRTSHEAADMLESVRLARAHRRILELLSAGSFTDEALADILVRERLSSVNGFRARRGELAKAELIDIVPDRTGLTRAGRRAQLWYITAAGVQALAALEYRDAQPPPETGEDDR